MNNRYSSAVQSRQTSVTPYGNLLQRNGYPSYKTSSPLPKSETKKINFSIQNENTDTIEMPIVVNQRKTDEAFDELEHLLSNDIPHRAAISELDLIVQDQDDTIGEISLEINQQTSHINSS